MVTTGFANRNLPLYDNLWDVPASRPPGTEYHILPTGCSTGSGGEEEEAA